LIDERAVVAPEARVHEDCHIGPYAVIGPGVEIGRGCRIESHVVIKGPTTLGEDNHIFQFASIGDDPQDKKYRGEPTELVIGSRNTIREYVTINRGTMQDEGVTRIGDDNWIMAYVHIAHDCVVGNHTIFANNATLAGHVRVDDYAFLGGFTGVHQFCQLGESSMCSMFSAITKDVPAYVIASGQPGTPRGINTEGLRRRGLSSERIRAIREAYRTVYRKGLALEAALESLRERSADQPEIEVFVTSISRGTRGLIR
jgi:UDP-N-acetylglucosamine acyltransferase